MSSGKHTMADDPPQNNLHRYWHKKPPDAPAPAEDSTLGMLSSRLVSFSCCHSPSRSNYVDLLFGSTGAPAEIRLGQLDDVGARAAPPDDSTLGMHRLASSRFLAATHPVAQVMLICCLDRQEHRLRFAWGNSTTWVLAQRHPTNRPLVCYRLASSRFLAATHPVPQVMLICCLDRQEHRLRFAWGNSTTWVLAQRQPKIRPLVCYLLASSRFPTGTPLFDPSFVAGPPVDTILEPGGEGISAARGEHLLADGSCRLFCRRRPSS